MVTKREPCDSFFNFFKPQELPTGEEDMDEDEEEKMVERIDQDFVRAMVIRDRIIPFGVLWFTGEATEGADNESGEGEDEDEDEEGEEGEGDDSKEEGDDSADKVSPADPPTAPNSR
jgi:nucleosome assembly protein 1-like 1